MKKITWKNIKRGYKTLGWTALKQQWQFLKNQSKLWSPLANITGLTSNFAQAKSYEKGMMTRMINKEGSVVSDAAELSSSVVSRGVWISDPNANSFSGDFQLPTRKRLSEMAE